MLCGVLEVALTLLSCSAAGPAAPTSEAAPASPAQPAQAPTPTQGVPAFQHVFVVVFENEAYDEIIGSREMPYFNELAGRYALATNYYANSHPSIGNYFMMTAGQLITRDDGYSLTIREDNIVRHMFADGKSWKSYAEDLPAVGYTGEDQRPYVRRHNPLSFFSDVVGDPEQKKNLVPLSQLADDLRSGSLPNYAFVVPNNIHNLHSCPVHGESCTEQEQMRLADTWLRETVGPLLESKSFQQSGLLLIIFDEAEESDKAHGGGRIPVIVAGSRVKPSYRSKTFYQHQSALQLTCAALRLESCPGAAATAPSMEEFFRE
jgi:acid phosphatase